MRLQEGLITKRLLNLKAFELYRQRFDACPHFMFFLGDAHGSDTNHSKYPYGQRITCAYFSRNKADWLHPMSELQYTAANIIELAKKNQHIAEDMVAHYMPWEKEFYKKCIGIDSTDLKSLKDSELIALYEDLVKLYTKKLNPSPLIDGFSLVTDTIISNRIEIFLEKKGLLKDFIKIFEVLTAPTFTSFLQEEEINFLKTAKKIKKVPKNKDILIKKHQQEYFWMHNNYVKDEILEADYFSNKLEETLRLDIDEKIKQLENLPKLNLKNKEKMNLSLQLPNDLRVLLHITDIFSKWQDERKKGTYWATHYFSVLLQEFSSRSGYNILELKYAMPDEMSLVLDKKIDKKLLKKRFEGCLLVWTKDFYEITTDKNLVNQIITGKEAKEPKSEIRGMSVSLGKACGTVKIVESADEISKIDKGDILVAVMTRPDYVPAMRKASGIITDEGGLTCHAAIVARELGIPCIVGTKTATKILSDGMIVEVNANHGIIKIVR